MSPKYKFIKSETLREAQKRARAEAAKERRKQREKERKRKIAEQKAAEKLELREFYMNQPHQPPRILDADWRKMAYLSERHQAKNAPSQVLYIDKKSAKIPEFNRFSSTVSYSAYNALLSSSTIWLRNTFK